MISMIDEKYWQEQWEKESVFISRSSDKKKFLITVPWPYTSGPLHVGHGRTYTIADFIARYRRLKGYNVLFPMGFHESGTPIEAISDKIRKGDPKTLDLYRKYISEYENDEKVEETLQLFKHPQNVADFFADKIVKDFKALGYSIDWTRTFRSVDERYKKMVEWQFRKLDSMGYLKKGSHAVLFSMEEKNAVGEDDIEDGDTNKVSIEEFTAVLFKGKNFYLAASSLRPETIYAITNIWINPNSKYSIMDIDGKHIVMSEDACERFLYQNEGARKIRDVDNAEILQEEYELPLYHRTVRVFPNRNIDQEHTTGIVYSVPGHSVKDYVYLKDAGINIENIRMIQIKNEMTDVKKYLDKYADLEEANQTLYRDEYYSGIINENVPVIGGKTVKESRDIIKKILIEEGMAFIFLETSRKARTRNGSRVVVSILRDQWFIDYSNPEWKRETAKHVNSMNFVPDFYRKNMQDIVDWIGERACARRRGLGTKLPMDTEWVIESLSDSTIYPAFYTVSPFIPEDAELKDETFDYIFKGNSLNSEFEKFEQAKKEFEYWYGVDQRITSSPHMSNHLIFYIMNHVALFNEKYWPAGITIAGTVISNGTKISKSKGNAVSLLDVVRKYGADMFRMYVAVNSDISSSLDWNERDIAIIRGKYEEILNILERSLSQNEYGDTISQELFRARFRKHMASYNEKMEKLAIRDAYVEIIYEVLNDLSELKNMGGSQERAVSGIAMEWLQALSCVIPHTAEHYWKSYGFEGLVSKSELGHYELSSEEKGLIEQWEYCKGIMVDIRSIEKVTHIDGKEVEIVLADHIIKEDTEKIIKNNFNVKRKEIIQAVKKMQNKITTGIDEKMALQRYARVIEKLMGMKIDYREYREGDKKVPLPGRPVINLRGERNGNN